MFRNILYTKKFILSCSTAHPRSHGVTRFIYAIHIFTWCLFSHRLYDYKVRLLSIIIFDDVGVLRFSYVRVQWAHMNVRLHIYWHRSVSYGLLNCEVIVAGIVCTRWKLSFTHNRYAHSVRPRENSSMSESMQSDTVNLSWSLLLDTHRLSAVCGIWSTFSDGTAQWRI